jgi:cytochrome c biogenesis protein CcdA
VFEFGRFLPSGVATLQARHPVVDAGLSGVLAVAVASPCTAPFMGASLGLAVGLPAAQALALFAALGLGMALPYLAASWLPAVARAAAARRVDGRVQEVHGLSHVRHRRVAAVGAGPAKRHRRRGRAAGAVGGAGAAAVGAGPGGARAG